MILTDTRSPKFKTERKVKALLVVVSKRDRRQVYKCLKLDGFQFQTVICPGVRSVGRRCKSFPDTSLSDTEAGLLTFDRKDATPFYRPINTCLGFCSAFV